MSETAKAHCSRFELESVIATTELHSRPSRAPDYRAECRALAELARAMAAGPRDILQKLAEAALELCRAGSAGVSILEEDLDGQQIFRWHALVGALGDHRWGTTPRGFSPCGTVLDRDEVMLFRRPGLHFPYLDQISPLIHDALLVPFHIGGQPVGTVWAVLHDDTQRFDAEDARRMQCLAAFASAAYQNRLEVEHRQAIEVAARQNDERLRALFRQAAVGMAILDLRGRFLEVNDRLCEILGRSAEELTCLTCQDLTHPDDWTENLTLIGDVAAGARPEFSLEKRYFHKQGRPIWVRATVSAIVDEEARAQHLLAIIEDVTDRRAAETLLAGQKQVLQMMAEGAPLPDLLAALVGIIETRSTKKVFGSVLLLENDGVHLRTGAAPSLPAEYVQAIDGLAIGPTAGSCGTAAHRRQPVVVADIATNPLWADYRDVALRHNLRSCWSQPVFGSSEQVLGTFAIYSTEPCMPDERDEELVRLLNRTAAIAIEHTRAEQALRESEQRFRTLADTAPAMLWVSDHNGHCTFLSHGWYAFTGQSEAESLGQGWLQALHPDDRQRALGQRDRAHKQGQPFAIDYRLRRADGEYRWSIDSGRPRFGENGELLGFIGSVIDAHERKQAEQALRRHYTQLHTLYRLSDAVARATGIDEMCELAIDGLLQAVGANRASVLLFGADEVMRFKSWRGLSDGYRVAVEGHSPWKPDDRDAQPMVIEDVTSADALGEELRETVLREGIRALSFIPLVDRERVLGKFMVYYDTPHRFDHEELAICRAIAGSVAFSLNRARAEQALRESERRYATLLSNLPGAVYRARLSALWPLEFASDGVLDLTGRSAEEFMSGRVKWGDVVHPDDLPRLKSDVAESMKRGRTFNLVYRIRRADGALRWVLDRGQLILRNDGHTAAIEGFVSDLTERVESEEALQQAKADAEAANRAKDEFLAALSHELRTPLTPVLMTAQAMEADPLFPRELLDDLHVLRRNVELEARLIDDLLDLTRVARGKLQMHPEVVDVHDVLRHAVDTCHESDIEPKRLRVSFDLEARDPVVWGDAARLEQVFWNLIKNAAKFTPDHGSIHISSRNIGSGQLCVEVQDSGVGISSEVLPHLFKAFEQGGPGVTRRFGGLGLGLAISKAILEMQGGGISARSEGLNRGATFAVTLPSLSLSDPRRQRIAAPGASHTSLASTKGFRILLVEDHVSTADVLARLLRGLEHQVDTAPSVERAMELASNQCYDLVISDLGLPDGSGHELMRHLRAQYALPGIALSGYGMEDDVEASRQAGFDTHLVKPVNFGSLEMAIARVMSTKA